MPGICENGHRSSTDDYCDTCGAPVRPSAPVGAARPLATATTQKCPNCGTSNPADALFCEACGYDYTTGTLPRSDVAGMLGLRREPVLVDTSAASVPPAVPAPSATPSYLGLSSAAPAEMSRPDLETASAAPIEDVAEPVPAAQPAGEAQEEQASAVPPPVEAAPVPAALAPAATPSSSPLDDDQPTRGRPAPRRESYVAEIWIDPDWYEVQETDEPMPSVALPVTVVLGVDNLIGRASASRNIHPEVDCGIDSGVSRRQARLSTDSTRWYVEDLGSANGTFVGPAAGPLPTTPIQGRYELGPDDRVYVGAWTRIVVRKASKDEVEALS